MALVVEDGSSKADANGYVSTAYADQYLCDHNEPVPVAWSGATEVRQEIAIKNATQWLDATYGLQWLGRRSEQLQRLDFPRRSIRDKDNFLIASTTMPRRLLEACVELALRDITETNGLMPDVTSTASNIKRELKQIGTLKKDIEYFGSKDVQTTFSIVQQLVDELISGPGVERA